MRRIAYIGALAAALLGSFLLTLWFTDTSPPVSKDPPLASERLAERQVSTPSELEMVTGAIGLKLSRRMLGSIDAINRINEREVAIAGWLADPEGDATPLNVVVFVAGRMAAATQTKGERPDVTTAKGLWFGAEKNVAFHVNVGCRAGQLPVVVGLGTGRQYYPLSARPCP